MNTRESYLPRSGPLPRPESVEEAAAVLAESAFENPGIDEVLFSTDEFTSLCPLSGQPDYCRVEIRYGPDAKCLESKSVKFYLMAFREHRGFTEAVAVRIKEDMTAAAGPRWLHVRLTQRPRGGLELVATAA